MEMIFKFGIVFVILAVFITCWILAIRSEKKDFNNGICPYCNTKFRCFDTDSQGCRGYTCDKCDHTVWVSYPCVDKNFKDDGKIFKKKKTYSSRIEELIYDKDSVVLFDVNGVLAKYEFGEHNHNLCESEDLNNDMAYYAPVMYDDVKPVEVFQELIKSKKPENVYVCSIAKDEERIAQTSFVRRFYGIPEENILFADSKENKLFVLDATRLQKRMMKHDIPDEKYILIDDDVETLSYIQDNSFYSTCHVSSFLE